MAPERGYGQNKAENISPEKLEELARPRSLIAVNLAKETLIVAMADPSDTETIDEIKRRTGYAVEAVVAAFSDIHKVLDRFFEKN